MRMTKRDAEALRWHEEDGKPEMQRITSERLLYSRAVYKLNDRAFALDWHPIKLRRAVNSLHKMLEIDWHAFSEGKPLTDSQKQVLTAMNSGHTKAILHAYCAKHNRQMPKLVKQLLS